jgi:hypothetical protein
VLRGVRYDTARAALIVGHGELMDADGYQLGRIYRTTEASFFNLSMQWAYGIWFVEVPTIEVVDPEDLLTLAKQILRDEDVLQFLSNWYCAGYLPKDDPFVQQWAEDVLSADDCEAIQARISRRCTTANRAT